MIFVAVITVGEVLPSSTSLEIVGVDETGSIYLVRQEAGVWEGQSIGGDADDPLHAVLAGDFVPALTGEEILVAGESGTITLLTRVQAIPTVSEAGLFAMMVLVLITGGFVFTRGWREPNRSGA